VDHVLVPRTYYAFQTESSLYLVTDFLNGGELFEHFTISLDFSAERTRQYSTELVSIILHLHSKGIIIQNTGLEDFCLDASGHLHLVDFDRARKLPAEKIKTRHFYETVYVSPETLSGGFLSSKIDWWLLGIVLYECISGHPPFYTADTEEMHRSILSRELPLRDEWDDDFKSLLIGLLQKDVEKRFGDEEVKRHPYFNGVNWAHVSKNG